MTERARGLTMREVEVSIFRPRVGDTLIIKSNQYLSKEQKDHWTAAMRSAVPVGVNILLMDGPLELIWIAPEPEVKK